MTHRYQQITMTPAAKRLQVLDGSRDAYARFEGGEETYRYMTDREAAFIAERDSFYMASVSETGWPYLQHRGGPRGFLKVLDQSTLGFLDFRGNRQFLTTANIEGDDRVSLMLIDYPNRRRLKVLGRARSVAIDSEPGLAEWLRPPGYKASPERVMTIAVEAFDWNCPQHITPRFTESEVEDRITPLRARISELEAAMALGSASIMPQI